MEDSSLFGFMELSDEVIDLKPISPGVRLWIWLILRKVEEERLALALFSTVFWYQISLAPLIMINSLCFFLI